MPTHATPDTRHDRIIAGRDLPMLLSPATVARMLDVPPDTIRTWARRGQIPHVRIGRLVRIPEDALRAWLAVRSARGGAA